MRNLLILGLAVFAAACGNASAPVSSVNNSQVRPEQTEKSETTIAHSTENQTPKPIGETATTGGKWSQSGDPIDTAKFDGVIAEAEKAVKAKPNDEAAKKTLSEAYFDRGFALTNARQYASALGDYRRALKLDPNNEDAKKWIDQIIGIYGMLKKEYPPEGEEPPPLPFKK